MFKKLYFIVLLCCFGLSSNLSNLSIREDDNSLLFKIEKDGKVNYMWGTHHIICHDKIIYKSLLNDLVEYVDIIVFEIDDVEPPISKDTFGKHMTGAEIPEAYKIKNILSREEGKKINQFLKEKGFPKEARNLFINTDIISFSFYTGMSLCVDMACINDGGIEGYIENIKSNETMYFLEDQRDVAFSMLMWMNYVHLNKEIIEGSLTFTSDEIIDNFEYECEKMYKESSDASTYNNNDIKSDWNDLLHEREKDELSKLMIDGMIESLLLYRNNQWMPKMINLMEDNDKVLFAVGALHLLDLAEKLRLEGYEVTALNIYVD